MYTDIRASVLIGRAFSQPFDMREGVRQGCPASPLVFSLYADRIEEFLQSELVAHLSARERSAVCIAGLSLPVLLFADDMVLLGTDREVVQRLLDTLGAFCTNNGLTVNVKKTKWLLGGRVPRDTQAECLRYGG